MAAPLNPQEYLQAISFLLHQAASKSLPRSELEAKVEEARHRFICIASIPPESKEAITKWSLQYRRLGDQLESIVAYSHDEKLAKSTEMASLIENALESCREAQWLFAVADNPFEKMLSSISEEQRAFVESTHFVIQEASVSTEASLSPKEVVIAGPVINDGLGDFFNMLSIASTLHEKYPGQPIRLIIRIDPAHYGKNREILQCPAWCSFEVALFTEEEKGISPAVLKQFKDKLISYGSLHQFLMPEATRRRIANAAFTVEYHAMKASIHLLPAPDLVIGEIGTPSCGLKREGLGIPIPKVEKHLERPLSSLSDSWLKERLEALYDPAKDVLGLFYFTKALGDVLPSNVATLLSCMDSSTSSAGTSKGNVVLLANQSVLAGPPIGFYKEIERLGFGRMIIEKKDGEKKSHLLDGGSRILYVLEAFPLSHDDMMTVFSKVTAPVIGCSGDQSLAEVIAFKRLLPCYQIRSHKKAFWAEEFIPFAEFVLGKAHPYIQYLQCMQELCNSKITEKRAEAILNELGKLLKMPVCFEGAALLHQTIANEKNSLTQIVKQIESKLAKSHSEDDAG